MALLQQSPLAFRVAVAITARRDGTTGQSEGQTILSYSRQAGAGIRASFLPPFSRVSSWNRDRRPQVQLVCCPPVYPL